MNIEVTHNQNVVHTVGVRLRKAREQLGLSQQTVAKRLCLKVSTIRDIEEDKEPINLALTFLRGYIRSYARLVNLPENELLPTTIDKQTSIITETNSSIRSFSLNLFNKRQDYWLMGCTWLVLIIVISLTGIRWWQNHKTQQEEITTMATNQLSPESNEYNNNISNMSSNNSDTTTATDKTQALTSFYMPLQNQHNIQMPIINNKDVSVNFKTPTITKNRIYPIQEERSFATIPSKNLKILEMNFTDDCWIEITDIAGKKIFSALQYKDTNLFFTDKILYRLKIGAPSAVKIRFQEKPINLDYFIKNNKVARLTLNAEQ